MISHKESILKSCDKLLKIDQGNITELKLNLVIKKNKLIGFIELNFVNFL